ncbi:MAG: tetratricopeptide repeat protein [bacterium]|nr:tetratricopeptide repeat protein [bacterium]
MERRKLLFKKSLSFSFSHLWLLLFLLILVSPLSLSEAAAQGAGEKSKYNLLLITIDTLRADHLGCYGYQNVKTPAIDALASEGILFTHALTPVPITLPSHVSIMTGLYPIQHGIQNNGNFLLPDSALTLAEVMKSQGYLTGACVGAFVLNSMFGLSQGFDEYNDSLPRKKRSSASPLDSERRAEEVTQSALRWLEKSHSQPFFLWVHYFDPHALYFPPSPFREQYKHHLYDGEIAYTDKCIGDLFNGLKRMGVWDKTVVILTADHGEGLGEHGEATHTIFIYETTLRVPLIIKAPSGLVPVSKTIKHKKISPMVTTLDIFPTIMDLFSIQPEGVSLSHLPGKSLLPLISGKCQTLHQEIFCETLYPELNFGWSRIEGIRTEDWKYIQAPKSELYHLAEDSAEDRNLLSTKPDLANEWEKKLSLLKEKLQKEKQHPKLIQDETALRRLESLGYFRAAKAKEEDKAAKASQKRADPKDMIHLIDGIDRGLSYYYLESYELAYNEFKKIIDVNPENLSATFYLACVEEKMGKFEQARDRFLHLLAMQPGYLEARNHLGIIYHQLGQLEQAMKEFQLALQESKYADVYYNLGMVYREMGKKDEAISAAKSALELDPDYSDAKNLLGEIALEKGELDEAYQHFMDTLKLEPKHLEARNNLGVVYFRRSRFEEALREFSQAAAIDPNSAEVQNNLGSLYLAQSSYSKAKDAFRKALSLRPNYADALVNLGTTYFKEGELEEAKKIYLQATRLAPNNPEVWNYLGLTYFTQGEYKSAVDPFETAIRLAPFRSDISLSLGKTYTNLRSFDQALSWFRKTTEIDPNNLEAYLLMGHVLYDELGKAQEAIMAWEKAHRLAPRDPVPLLNLAAVNFQTEKYPEAIALWKKVIEIDPNSNEAYLHIGTAYLKQDNLDEAIQSWQKILNRTPAHPEAMINLGTAFYKKGDYEKAIELWQKAAQLSPKDPKVHYNLALALIYRRDYRQSLQELEEVLRLEPDNIQARMLMETVKQQESW